MNCLNPEQTFESNTQKNVSLLINKIRNENYLPSIDEIDQIIKNSTRETFKEFWNVENHQIFELWNKEYIDALAKYLIAKGIEYNKVDEPLVVLEIGAGDGKLTNFLNQKIGEISPNKVKIIATDSGDWEIKNVFPVEKIKDTEALKKYNPDIVIFSWMPQGEDSTQSIRDCKNVKVYILIGEIDGTCGHDWKTWGYSEYHMPGEIANEELKSPPFEVDGFTKITLHDLSKLQRGKNDFVYKEDSIMTHSRTTLFKREK